MKREKWVVMGLLLALLLALAACSSAQVSELAPTVEAAVQEVAPTLQAAATELAPTLQAAVTELAPTVESAIEAGAATLEAVATAVAPTEAPEATAEPAPTEEAATGEMAAEECAETYEGETIVIYQAAGLTGPLAQILGDGFINGSNDAVERINAEGGVCGVQLELHLEDSQYDPEQELAIYERYRAEERPPCST